MDSPKEKKNLSKYQNNPLKASKKFLLKENSSNPNISIEKGSLVPATHERLLYIGGSPRLTDSPKRDSEVIVYKVKKQEPFSRKIHKTQEPKSQNAKV